MGNGHTYDFQQKNFKRCVRHNFCIYMSLYILRGSFPASFMICEKEFPFHLNYLIGQLLYYYYYIITIHSQGSKSNGRREGGVELEIIFLVRGHP